MKLNVFFFFLRGYQNFNNMIKLYGGIHWEKCKNYLEKRL